ncbi:type IV secretion system protein [Wolinella succinogenes]|uniref:type IV secretion system protein n=1 Tax=Wolinella succinogenes TaxID=844 RepID=UPI00067440A7|nr:VirB8/TrbF family protein [Wolinella succinogenes]VEG82403.1 Type IV secretion system protein virB8 [Wolinella succinogenes]
MIDYLLLACIAELLVIVVLITAIITLFPLKEKEPYLVHFSNAEQNFVTLERAGAELRSDKAVLTALMATYVRNREMIDRMTEKERFEEVRLQSSAKVWRSFETLVNTENSIYAQKKLKREIRLVNISFLRVGISTVDFIAKTTNGENGSTISEERYRAVLSYGFADTKLRFDEKNMNPTGFLVNDYGVTQINIGDAL